MPQAGNSCSKKGDCGGTREIQTTASTRHTGLGILMLIAIGGHVLRSSRNLLKWEFHRWIPQRPDSFPREGTFHSHYISRKQADNRTSLAPVDNCGWLQCMILYLYSRQKAIQDNKKNIIKFSVNLENNFHEGQEKEKVIYHWANMKPTQDCSSQTGWHWKENETLKAQGYYPSNACFED